MRYTPNGLSFDDGSELPADVIVWTTGFVNNLRSHIRTMFGDEVFQKTEDFYGLNEEGELLGAFKLMERKCSRLPQMSRCAFEPESVKADKIACFRTASLVLRICFCASAALLSVCGYVD